MTAMASAAFFCSKVKSVFMKSPFQVEKINAYGGDCDTERYADK